MKRRRVSRFGLFAVIYAAVIIVAAVAALATLWRFLAEYERTLPVRAAEEYAASLDGAAIKQLIEADSGIPSAGKFETRAKIAAFLADSAAGREFAVSRDVRASREDKPVFALKSDGRRFCAVTLAETGKAMFGLREWKVASVALDAGFFPEPEFAVAVTVPEGADLTVNGAAPGPDYIVSADEYGGLNKFERGRPGAPRSVTYEITGLYARPTVAASLDGETLAADFAGDVANYAGDIYSFPYPDSASRAVSVTAPAGAVVTLNGVAVGEEFLTGRSEPYPCLTAFESAGELRMLQYEIGGLYMAPELSAQLGNTVLECARDGGAYVFTVPASAMYTALITAPAGVEVSVNGVAVGGEFAVGSSGYACLEGLENFIGEPPSASSYKIEGLYKPPEIAAAGLDAVLTAQPGGDGTTVSRAFVRRPDESLRARLGAAAEEFVRAYVYYNAQGYVNIEANYKKVKDLLLPGTETAGLIAQSYWAVNWNNNYDYIKYSKLEPSNFIVYRDGLYSCDISFALEQRRYHFVRNYDETFTLVFLNTQNGLMVANLIFN